MLRNIWGSGSLIESTLRWLHIRNLIIGFSMPAMAIAGLGMLGLPIRRIGKGRAIERSDSRREILYKLKWN